MPDYYHADHLGTPRLITNSRHERVAQPNYYPFGEEVTTTGNQQTIDDKKFTGHQRDTLGTAGVAEDIDYMHARFYSPLLGRFLSTDPVLGMQQSPQSWNRYSYVEGRPLTRTDPTGKLATAQTADKAISMVETAGAAAADAVNDGSVMGVYVATQIANGVTAATSVIDLLKAGDAVGTAIGSGASPGQITVAVAVDSLRTAGLIAPLSSLLRRGATAGATEVVQRAMSTAELEATRASGLLRGGRSGTHYVSDAISSSADRARQRLALAQTPEVRVTLEVPAGAFSAPTRVTPANGMPGGGMERTATGSILVRILDVLSYR
ncbi:MAG: hypothetical protein IPJ17_12350 [Holophagales bacterium]|nr:MAG: hypothetical protein IPJ17_12350 [Holophagales bacterium]